MINKKIPSEIAVGIVLLVAIIIGGVFYLKSKKEITEIASEIKQENKIADKPVPGENNSQAVKQDNTLAETERVNFCGKIYESDLVIIGDIDVISTISKIANKETWLCKNMELGNFIKSGVSIVQKKDESANNSYLAVLLHKGNVTEEADPFNQSPYIFKFDFDKNQVFYQDQIDGRFRPIGNIK